VYHRERYYVYALAYPQDYYDGGNDLNDVVFYIGKGTGDRIDSHEMEAGNRSSICHCKKCKVIRKIWIDGKQVQKHKLLEGVKESEAFAFERRCILDLYAGPCLINRRDNPRYYEQERKTAREVVLHSLDEDVLDQTLTSQEACKVLGVEYTTLVRYAKTGRIRKYRGGIRNVVFRRVDVERLKRDLEEVRRVCQVFCVSRFHDWGSLPANSMAKQLRAGFQL